MIDERPADFELDPATLRAALLDALMPPAGPANAIIQHANGVRHPALRYLGSKWRLARWIRGYLPAHELYCEPFCGGASLLLQKPISPKEVINDLDETVMTFWHVLRDRPEELLYYLACTPFGRASLREAQQPSADPVIRAARLFMHCWLAANYHNVDSLMLVQTGPNRQDYRQSYYHAIANLPAVVGRLRSVILEQGEAITIIERYDSAQTCFYIDPPYAAEARSGKEYAHDMSDADHEALAECLHQVQGMVLLSGYPSPLYERLYPDWRHVDKVTSTNFNHRRTERLWLSPNVPSSIQERLL